MLYPIITSEHPRELSPSGLVSQVLGAVCASGAMFWDYVSQENRHMVESHLEGRCKARFDKPRRLIRLPLSTVAAVSSRLSFQAHVSTLKVDPGWETRGGSTSEEPETLDTRDTACLGPEKWN